MAMARESTSSRAPHELPEDKAYRNPQTPDFPMIHRIIQGNTLLSNLHTKSRKVPCHRWTSIAYQSQETEYKASLHRRDFSSRA